MDKRRVFHHMYNEDVHSDHRWKEISRYNKYIEDWDDFDSNGSKRNSSLLFNETNRGKESDLIIFQYTSPITKSANNF